jgi:hypothetical protein
VDVNNRLVDRQMQPVLHALTGVALVQSQFSQYRDCWLYSLALLYEVEVSHLDLCDKSSDAAFALCALLAQYMGSPGLPQQAEEDANEEDDQESPSRLEWDEQLAPLPGELSLIWQGVKGSARKLDLRQLLETVPKFMDLPNQAPTNNHRLDGKKDQDKSIKAWSQSLLHSLRVQAYIFQLMLVGKNPQMVKILFEQHFQMTTELYHKLCNARKEFSIPGSVPTTQDVLFDKDSLQLAQQQQKVNRAGFSFSSIVPVYQSLFDSKIITSLSGSRFGKSFGKGWQRFPRMGPYNYGRSGHGDQTKGQGDHIFSSYAGFQFNSARGQGGRGKGFKGRGLLFNRLSESDNSPPLQADKKIIMVDSQWQPPGDSVYKTWSSGPMARRCWTRPFPKNQTYARLSIDCCSGAFAGLPLHWCHPGSNSPSSSVHSRFFAHSGYKTPGALVHCFQNRRHKNKAPFDNGLQGNKQIFTLPSFQNGPLGSNFSFCQERHVGLQNRFERCLFSSSFRKKPQTLPGAPGGQPTVSVFGSSIWSKRSPLFVDPNNESPFKDLEEKRSSNFCLFGRHPFTGSSSTKTLQGFAIGTENFRSGRTTNKPQEVSFESYSANKVVDIVNPP